MATDIWAYCGQSWAEATFHATKTTPITSPRTDAISLRWPQERPLLAVFNLHGDEVGQPGWYGQADDGKRPLAVAVPNVRAYDWTGVVVVAMVCWSAAYGGQEMAQAFLDGGALAFIGSTSEAYGRRQPVNWLARLLGKTNKADSLIAHFVHLYRNAPGNPARTLVEAKERFAREAGRLDKVDKLTLESFICIKRTED